MKEKAYVKDGQVKQVLDKLCSGGAESYLKWKRQLDHVIKSKPCESPKSKIDMDDVILYSDLLKIGNCEGKLKGKRRWRNFLGKEILGPSM